MFLLTGLSAVSAIGLCKEINNYPNDEIGVFENHPPTLEIFRVTSIHRWWDGTYWANLEWSASDVDGEMEDVRLLINYTEFGWQGKSPWSCIDVIYETRLIFDANGTYLVEGKVQDHHGAYSEVKSIEVKCEKEINHPAFTSILTNLFNNHLNLFPLFQQLLQRLPAFQ